MKLTMTNDSGEVYDVFNVEAAGGKYRHLTDSDGDAVEAIDAIRQCLLWEEANSPFGEGTSAP
jgi:hypothetical protein